MYVVSENPKTPLQTRYLTLTHASYPLTLLFLAVLETGFAQYHVSLGDMVNLKTASFASRLLRTSGSGDGSTFLGGALAHCLHL